MANATPIHEIHQGQDAKNALEDVLREGARQLLQTAIEEEVAAYVAAHAAERDENGHRLVVRNGHAPPRTIQTGLGDIEFTRPRVDDRRTDEDGNRRRFQSTLLPPYLRRSKSIEELLPWLYLKGISTGDFGEALQSLLGTDAPGLSATTIVRLKKVWEDDFAAWSARRLGGKRYVYLWVDGIHCNVRLEGGRPCILVVMGATSDGKKELLAVEDGVRESEQSWKEVLLDLKARGLEGGPELVVGDGALGFWKALPQVWPDARQQRCWFHKSGNERVRSRSNYRAQFRPRRPGPPPRYDAAHHCGGSPTGSTGATQPPLWGPRSGDHIVGGTRDASSPLRVRGVIIERRAMQLQPALEGPVAEI